MSSTFRQSELGQAVGGSLSAILDALLNKLLGSGLSALGGLVNSAPSIDNWNYDGQTLSNNNGASTQSLTIPTSVLLKVGDTTPSALISGGIAPYKIVSQLLDTTVATAKVSGSTLTVTGVGAGQASLVVQDSSSPVQTATAQITVSKTGTLIVDFNNPSALKNISTGISGTSLDLSGGTQPYNITTQANSSVAMAVVSGDSLVIVGVNPGVTSISLQDSSTSTKNVTLQITVGSESVMSATPQNVSVSSGGTALVTMSGGTAPYNVTVPASSIASAIISGNTLTVTGSATGTTSVTIQDSFSPAETITIPITVSGSATTTPLNTTQ
jgi:hypothetical protein